MNSATIVHNKPAETRGTLDNVNLGARSFSPKRTVQIEKGQFVAVHISESGCRTLHVMKRKRIWWMPWRYKFTFLESASLSWSVK